jgi:S-DNA-T family DNA segregation ATPase FtsK/SpoIIIE
LSSRSKLPVPEPKEDVPQSKSCEFYHLIDPILDLRDYKYPKLDLLDQHSNEKIVMDSTELEANKNQIINTLKNYDIAIQKIVCYCGAPTVYTL